MAFLDSFSQILSFAFSFVSNLINSLIQMFQFLGSAVALPLIFIPLVPAVISSCIIFVVGMSILKLIIGR